MSNESKDPPLGYKIIQEMTATKLLNAAAPEMLEALELCADYIKDLQNENFEDLDVGIRYDYQLRKAHDALITAIKKAKGEI